MKSLLKLKISLETMKEFAAIALAVLLFSSFIVSQNKIPTPSMVSTLRVGDRLLVSPIPLYYRYPKRGEVVVFNGPDGKPWIKRVIGLPGERIEILDGNIYINGNYLDESGYVFEIGSSTLDPTEKTVIEFPYTVPEGHYFLMGDNRLQSLDCRYIGAIDGNQIVGKALIKIYPFKQIGIIK